MLDSKSEGQSQQPQQQSYQAPQQRQVPTYQENIPAIDIDESSIPF